MYRQMIELGAVTLYEAGATLLDSEIAPAWPGAVLCGPAYTVTCVTGDNLALHRAIELCGPHEVLVADGGGLLVGYWGEIMTAAAQYRQIAGLIVDGGVRDLDRLMQREFPVFARGRGARRATKTEPGQTGMPVKIGGAVIQPGDIVLADTDGTVVIPTPAFDEVMAAARKRAATEADYLRELTGGVSTIDLLGLRDRV